MIEVAVAILVGLLWGLTNPLIKRGSVKASEKARQLASSTANAGAASAELRALLSTPAFLVPQALNQCGGALFALLLGRGARVTAAVPAANGVALAANAVADAALGEPYRLELLVPGVALVAAGLALCASSSS
jgi:hypothetical protein